MVEEIKGAFRINIGCGDRKHPGFINVDVCEVKGNRASLGISGCPDPLFSVVALWGLW